MNPDPEDVHEERADRMDIRIAVGVTIALVLMCGLGGVVCVVRQTARRGVGMPFTPPAAAGTVGSVTTGLGPGMDISVQSWLQSFHDGSESHFGTTAWTEAKRGQLLERRRLVKRVLGEPGAHKLVEVTQTRGDFVRTRVEISVQYEKAPADVVITLVDDPVNGMPRIDEFEITSPFLDGAK